MRTDRLTDITKTKITFRDYANTHNNASTRNARKSTLRFGYENQLTYVGQGYNCCFAEIHIKQINALLDRTQNFLTLKLLVLIVCTWLCVVNI